MEVEHPGRIVFGFLFGIVFPLFAIFTYTQFTYAGVSLYNDIFLGFKSNVINSIFLWTYSLFKGDIIYQIGQNGLLGFISQPLLPALFTWFLTGYFVGVIIKNYKKAFAVSFLTVLILFVIFLISIFIDNASFGTINLVFKTNLFHLLGSLLTLFIFMPLGVTIGCLIGKD